jgi:hypothetical protein
MEQKNNHKRGGARPNSGRPRKDPDQWGQISIVLRRDTIEKIKAGAGGGNARLGQFLQDHFDRHPVPSRELYLHLLEMKAIRANPSNPERDRRIRHMQRAERDRQRMEKRHNAAMARRDRQIEWQKKRISSLSPGPNKDAAREELKKMIKDRKFWHRMYIDPEFSRKFWASLPSSKEPAKTDSEAAA